MGSAKRIEYGQPLVARGPGCGVSVLVRHLRGHSANQDVSYLCGRSIKIRLFTRHCNYSNVRPNAQDTLQAFDLCRARCAAE